MWLFLILHLSSWNAFHILLRIVVSLDKIILFDFLQIVEYVISVLLLYIISNM